MRFPRSVRTAPAIVAFLAALALSVPGVQVARADEEPAADRFQRFERFAAGEEARAGAPGCSAAAHGSCSAPGSGSCPAPHRGLAQLRRGMATWQALVDRARRHARAGGETGGPVALNGRGYNY